MLLRFPTKLYLPKITVVQREQQWAAVVNYDVIKLQVGYTSVDVKTDRRYFLHILEHKIEIPPTQLLLLIIYSYQSICFDRQTVIFRQLKSVQKYKLVFNYMDWYYLT